jgi:hypothetical protein
MNISLTCQQKRHLLVCFSRDERSRKHTGEVTTIYFNDDVPMFIVPRSVLAKRCLSVMMFECCLSGCSKGGSNGNKFESWDR